MTCCSYLWCHNVITTKCLYYFVISNLVLVIKSLKAYTVKVLQNMTMTALRCIMSSIAIPLTEIFKQKERMKAFILLTNIAILIASAIASTKLCHYAFLRVTIDPHITQISTSYLYGLSVSKENVQSSLTS